MGITKAFGKEREREKGKARKKMKNA